MSQVPSLADRDEEHCFVELAQVAHLVHDRRERDLASWLVEIAGRFHHRDAASEFLAATVEPVWIGSLT